MLTDVSFKNFDGIPCGQMLCVDLILVVVDRSTPSVVILIGKI